MRDVVDRVRCELNHATGFYDADLNRETTIADYSRDLAKQYLDDNEKKYPGTVFANDDQLDSDQKSAIKKEATKSYGEKHGVYKIGNFLDTLAAQFELTLQVKDSNGIGNNAAAGTWGGIPIPDGLFSLKATGGLQATSRRTAKFKVSLYLGEARRMKGKELERCRALQSNRTTDIRLEGSFGVDAFLKRSVDTAFATDPRHFKSISTTIEFTLTPTAGVAPTWAISRPKARTFNGTFVWGVQRDYQNTLDFVIIPIDEAGSGGGVQKVVVTNFPPGIGPGPPAPPRTQGKKDADRRDALEKEFPVRKFDGKVDPFTQQRLDNELFRLQLPRTLQGQ